jgi:hypothetical protein
MHRRVFLGSASRAGVVLCGTVLLAVFAAGCGSSDGPERFDVSGTLTYEGKPIPYGIIVFSNKETLYDTGCTIEDGEYESQDGKGHTGGKFKVSVEAWTAMAEAWEDEAPKLFTGTYNKEIELAPENTVLNLDFKKEDFAGLKEGGL